MNKNLLEDFERAEYYEQAYKSRNKKCLIFCLLSFILGFVIVKAYYLINL